MFISIGIGPGLYRRRPDCPWYGVTKEEVRKGVGATDEDPAGLAKKKAKVAVEAVEVAGGADSSSVDDAEVKESTSVETNDVAKLRRRAKSTLFLCASILSKDNVLATVRMIMVFCKPIYDTHAEHAKTVRPATATRTSYLDTACGAHLTPPGESHRIIVRDGSLGTHGAGRHFRRASKSPIENLGATARG